MDISVVIPTHNRASLLPRALDSVHSQSHPVREVIVVDDGSTDDTQEVLSRSYPEVIHIRQSNQGVSQARNRGISAATCAWIALLDSDDCWHMDKLAAQVGALANNPGHLLCHTDEIWVRSGVRVNPMRKHAKSGGWIYRDCLPLCAISPSSVMVHQELLERVGGFDESLPACEDYDLWLRICAANPVLYIDRALITKYGGHADQLSRRHWGMDRFRVRALEKILRSGVLGVGDWIATVETLLRKLLILVEGARKRENREMLDLYLPKLEYWYARSANGPGRPPKSVAAC